MCIISPDHLSVSAGDALQKGPSLLSCRSDPEFLYRILAVVIEAGATTLNIPDTVGYTMPSEYGELIEKLRKNTPGADRVIFSTHCQNDLGLATANTLAVSGTSVMGYDWALQTFGV